MTQNDAWQQRLTASTANQIEQIRKRRGMSAQALADATAELGYPIARSVIANLENGRRESVTVAELLVLARALDVPPVLLVFPVGDAPEAEVLPGTLVRTWAATQWFTGEAPLPLETPGHRWADRQRWEDNATALFRGNAAAIKRWLDADENVRTSRKADRAEREREWRDVALDRLREHRQEMRQLGVEPDPLPAVIPLDPDDEDLFYVDDEEN
jgi:transcriptional regulator with XRE-family HTH domain